MTKRILVLDGHPDATAERFVHALAQAYCAGAQDRGHDVRVIRLADLELPVLRSQKDFEGGAVVDDVRRCQEALLWADHLVLLYPLWLGSMPAFLKAWTEQVFRPGFAFQYRERGFPQKHLKGKTARLIVTMGMPALMYRWFYGAHSVRSVRRNILKFVGYTRVRQTLIGGAGNLSAATGHRWLKAVEVLGRDAR